MAVVEWNLHDRKELWFPYLVCKISVVCMEPASWKIISYNNNIIINSISIAHNSNKLSVALYNK